MTTKKLTHIGKGTTAGSSNIANARFTIIQMYIIESMPQWMYNLYSLKKERERENVCNSVTHLQGH